MFLTARLFGVFTYTALLIGAVFSLRYAPKSQIKYIVWLYLMALCVIAWLYVPYLTTDIYRLAQYAQTYSTFAWNDFIYLLLQSKTSMFTLLFFRFFPNLLMPITCFLVFGIIFYIIYSTGNFLKASRTTIILALFWIMTNDFYLTAISNIRSYLAVAFVAFCIHRETFKNKFSLLNILLYFCAIESHSMGIILVAFRILAYLLSGSKMTIWKIIFIPIILTGLVLGFTQYAPLLLSATEKFEDYYNYVDYNYLWERVIFTIQTFVQGYIIWKSFTYRVFREKAFASYKTLATGGFIVLLICQLHVTFMQRWIIFSAILDIPLLMRLLQEENRRNRHQVKQFVIASCLLTFAFVCSRGNLCSLKFWE